MTKENNKHRQQTDKKLLVTGLSLLVVGCLIWTSFSFASSQSGAGQSDQSDAIKSLLREVEDLRNRVVRAEALCSAAASTAGADLGSAGSIGGGGQTAAAALAAVAASSTSAAAVAASPDPLPGLAAPAGTDQRKNSMYGGAGDAIHLGGFTQNDTMGQSPALWHWMVQTLNIRSFVDIGCGRGISTKWMKDHNVKVSSYL